MAFESKLFRKPGKPDRTARTPSEAVQFKWDGYKEVKAEDAPAPEVKEAEPAKADETASAPSDAEKAAANKADAEKPQPAAPKPAAPKS